MKTLSDLFTISYTDPYNLWDSLRSNFENLKTFEILLTRNLELENMGNRIYINFPLDINNTNNISSKSTNFDNNNNNNLDKLDRLSENKNKEQLKKDSFESSKNKKKVEKIEVECVYVNMKTFTSTEGNNTKKDQQSVNTTNTSGSDNNNNTNDNTNVGTGNTTSNNLNTNTLGSTITSIDNKNKEQKEEKLMNTPYIHMLLLPCLGLKEYRTGLKPKLNHFINDIVLNSQNAINVDFVIVLVNSQTGSSSSQELLHKVKNKLHKRKLPSSVIVFNPNQTKDRHTSLSPSNSSNLSSMEGSRTSIRSLGSYGNSNELRNKLHSVLTMSINKRYLFLLIELNQLLSESTKYTSLGSTNTGSNVTGNRNINSSTNTNTTKDFQNNNTSSSSHDLKLDITSMNTTGRDDNSSTNTTDNQNNNKNTITNDYVTINMSETKILMKTTRWFECLVDLFQKLKLSLEIIFIYENILYNKYFNSFIKFIKTLDHKLNYNNFIIINNPVYHINNFNFFSFSASEENNTGFRNKNMNYVYYRVYVLSKQLLLLDNLYNNVFGDENVIVTTDEEYVNKEKEQQYTILFLSVLLIYNFIKDLYFVIFPYNTVNQQSHESSSGDNDLVTTNTNNDNNYEHKSSEEQNKKNWLLLLILELLYYIENKVNILYNKDQQSVNTTGVEDKNTSTISKSGSYSQDTNVGTDSNDNKNKNKEQLKKDSFESSKNKLTGINSKKMKKFKSLFKSNSKLNPLNSKLNISKKSKKDISYEQNSNKNNVENKMKSFIFNFYNIKCSNNNIYKYISFIYLILYKLVNRRNYNKSEDQKLRIVNNKLINYEVDDHDYNMYMNSLYNSILLMSYNNISEESKLKETQEDIKNQLNNINKFNVNITNKCIKYFLLSNLQNYSSIFYEYNFVKKQKILFGEKKGELVDKVNGSYYELYESTNFDNNNNNLDKLDRLSESKSYSKDARDDKDDTSLVNNNKLIGTNSNTNLYYENGAVSVNEGRMMDLELEGREERISCVMRDCNEYEHMYKKISNRNSEGENYEYTNSQGSMEENRRDREDRNNNVYLYDNSDNYVHITLVNNSSNSNFTKDSNTTGVEDKNTNTINTSGNNNKKLCLKFNYPNTSTKLLIHYDALYVINVDNKIVNNRLEREEKTAIFTLPKFKNKLILCSLIRLRNYSSFSSNVTGNRNINASNATTNSNISQSGFDSDISKINVCVYDDDTILLNKNFKIVINEVFNVKINEIDNVKYIYVNILYKNLVKIHNIYMNQNIIGGTTLLDHNSTYKIIHNQQDVNNTNDDVNKDLDGNSNGSVNVGDNNRTTDVLRIYYTLYRKYRLTLQKLTYDQLICCIELDKLLSQSTEYISSSTKTLGSTLFNTNTNNTNRDSTNTSNNKDKYLYKHDSKDISSTKFTTALKPYMSNKFENNGDTIKLSRTINGNKMVVNNNTFVNYTVNIPYYGYVYKSIDVNIYLVSNNNVKLKYHINFDSNNWFIEGLIINNNLNLVRDKKFTLFFKLIPLRSGNLQLPNVYFNDVDFNLQLMNRYIIVFPNPNGYVNNYIN